MRWTMATAVPVLAVALLSLTACGGGAAGAPDAAAPDTGPDLGAPDLGPPDTGPDTVDAGPETPPPLPEEEASYGLFQLYGQEFAYFRQQLGLTDETFGAWLDTQAVALDVHWTALRNLLVWGRLQPTLTSAVSFAEAAGPDVTLQAVFRAAPEKTVNAILIVDPSRYGTEGPVFPDGFEEGFAAFTRAAVERYDGDGQDDLAPEVRVRYWQCMEAPADAIAQNRLSPQRYAELVAVFAGAVRAADPQGRVVLGHLGSHLSAVVAALQDQGAFDAVDVHVTDYGAAGAAEGLPEGPAIRELLDRNGYSSAALYSLVQSTYAGQPRPDLAVRAEADQAAWLVRSLVGARAAGATRVLWAGLVDWYNYGGDPQSPMNGVGLIDDGAGPGADPARLGTPRAAFYALQRLVQTTDERHARWLGPVAELPAEVRAYAFSDRHSGLRRVVAWTTGTAPISAFLPVGDASRAHYESYVTDGAGIPSVTGDVNVVAGFAEVPLTTAPLVVEPRIGAAP